MKIRVFLLGIILLAGINTGFAQSQGDKPRGNWSEWQTVYEQAATPVNLKVEISFNVSQCGKNGLVGYSYWRIRNTFTRPKVYLKFSFDAVNCNGITTTIPITYEMAHPEVTNQLSDHFDGYQVIKISAGKPEDYNIKNVTPQKSADLDNSKQTFDDTYASYNAKLSKIQNPQLKQQYAAALQNAKTQFGSGYQLAQQYAQQGNTQNLQSQLSYLQKVNKQLDDNYNLMNDVVERQVGASVTKTPTVAKTVSNKGFDTQKSYTENATTVQSDLNVNAQVSRELVNLVDKYLVDKDKLKDNALASASLDFAKKAQLANNRDEREVNTVAAGVLGLAALFTNNSPAKVGLTEEEIELRKNDLVSKVNAARPYYLDVVQKSIYALLDDLKISTVTDTKKMISIIHKLYETQKIAYEIKESMVCVDRANRVSYYFFNFDDEIMKLKKVNGENYDITWDMLNEDKTGKSAKRFLNYRITQGGNVLAEAVPNNAGTRKKIMSGTDINSFFVSANYYIKNKKPVQAFDYLRKIDAENYRVDTLIDDSAKNNYFIHYYKDYKYKGIAEADFYSFGALGLKKVVATNLLADMMIDSAVLYKDAKKLQLGIEKMSDAYRWFSNNLMTAKSPNYENDGHQFDILNALFKDYIDATALLLTYSSDEAAKKQSLETLANDILSYIDYSAKKIPRTEINLY